MRRELDVSSNQVCIVLAHLDMVELVLKEERSNNVLCMDIDGTQVDMSMSSAVDTPSVYVADTQ